MMNNNVGWFCHYTPVEIISALGYQPCRITGKEGNTPRADTQLMGNLCPYVKSCLELAIRQELPPLAATVIVRSCNAMIHLANFWPRFSPAQTTLVLDVPGIVDEGAIVYFSQNLRQLAQKLSQIDGRQLNDSDLWDSIHSWQEQRNFWHRLSAARAAGECRLSGDDYTSLLTKWQTAKLEGGPKDWESLVPGPDGQSHGQLDRQSDGPAHGHPDAQQKGKSPDGPRLMVSGSILPADLVPMLEACGGRPVIEDACNRQRFISMMLAPETEDPYLHLARMYLSGPPCPRITGSLAHRREYWARLADEYHIEGVIYHAMKFCDAAIFDFKALKDFCDQRKLPLLRIDGDWTKGARGQWQTRIEAFLEMF